MKKAVNKPPHSGNISVDSAPPFLPLEDSMARSRSGTESSFDEEIEPLIIAKKRTKTAHMRSRIPMVDGKKIILIVFAMFFLTVIWESFFVEPEERLLQPDFSDKLLQWVELNPGWGLGAISLIIAGGVVTMVPIGTPLTVGCGFIYRGVYGWKLGIFVATVVSMSGSLLGAVSCFLLGRYLMRDTVRRWVRKYPLFDAIDVGKTN
jgi:hypothetical protein